MEISIKRDGLTLRGDLLRPENVQKCPVAILFHGFMGSRQERMFLELSKRLTANGIAVVKFDFDGHGDSDGEFSDMNVYSEILDASKIIDYVRSLDFVTDIYICGHSQGALVGGMISGYYREFVKKLVMLAPAATIKDDALNGHLFGMKYDTYNMPESMPVRNLLGEYFDTGNLYMRTARTLPIYDTTSQFTGPVLIMHGTADAAVGIIGSQRYKDAMPNVELELIEGEGHGFDNSLDYVAQKAVDFLLQKG